MAEVYSEARLATLALDLPGHGRSEGKRGHASFVLIREVIDRFLAEARLRFPGLPVFLSGLSMGGLLALDYLIERKPAIAGAVIMSPGFAGKEPVSAWRLFLAHLMAGIWPSFTISNGLPEDGCSDPEALREWNEDPLAHVMISARMGLDVIQAGPRVEGLAHEIGLPLLILQGSADKVVDPEATERFMASAGTNITYRRLEGLNHDLPHELEKEAVFSAAIGWISERV
jgi:alpha-beta hydrolase superfamily lysophospholipase